MKSLTLAQIAEWSGGALLQGTPSSPVDAISTDSRSVSASDLFVALKGDNHDAHKFIADVGDAGAILVHSLPEATESYPGGIIRVKDTLEGLQSLAFHLRRDSSDLYVVGITGSNGKTSTKDFLNAVLSADGQVNCTAGNLNNHIGLPLTILSGNDSDRYGVWEMGMNHPGEIEVLAEIARPDAAVITNIGTAHIEHMKTREAIALEKSELALAVPASGFCAMPVKNDFFGYVSDRVSCEMISVGIDEGDIQAQGLVSDPSGRIAYQLCSEAGPAQTVTLGVRGRHMVVNSLLAAATGLKRGMDPAAVAKALNHATLTGGRLEEKSVNGYAILDDSYNANPDSMLAAFATLKEADVTGRRVAVLGFMGELGDFEKPEHHRVGENLAANDIDALVTVGDRAAVINDGAGNLETNKNFANHEEAAAFLSDFLSTDDLVLLKGSRAAGMEKVIASLT